MKKHKCLMGLISLVLLFVMAVSPALAVDSSQSAAEELYDLGLFQGVGTSTTGEPIFALEREPNRAEAMTMLVRLLGKEDEALVGSWQTPFMDVPEWAAPYVGYAYNNDLTTGISDDEFGSAETISAAEYLTFVLRALGYESGKDFAWNSPWTLTDKIGLCPGEYNANTINFTRGDIAVISYNALDIKLKDSSKTLKEVLAENGVFDSPTEVYFSAEVLSCHEDCLVFDLYTIQDTKGQYSDFSVNRVTVNGLSTSVDYYDRAELVDVLKQQGIDTSGLLPEIFGAIAIFYDERMAASQATETTTEDGIVYPVLKIDFECTGTKPDGSKVPENFTIKIFINGYSGPEFIKQQ